MRHVPCSAHTGDGFQCGATPSTDNGEGNWLCAAHGRTHTGRQGSRYTYSYRIGDERVRYGDTSDPDVERIVRDVRVLHVVPDNVRISVIVSMLGST